MENEQIVINTLLSRYTEKGYVTEDEILDLCTEYDLPFHRIDYVCDQIISKGVLISDNSTIQAEFDDVSDNARVDYEAIYNKVLEVCPEMKATVCQIRIISPPQKGETKNLLIQARSGNKFAREKLIKMYLRTALRISLQYIEQTSIPVEDLFSVACLGLIKAVDSYSEESNSHFVNHICLWIRQQLDRYIMYNEPLFSRHINQTGSTRSRKIYSLDKILEDDEGIRFKSNFDMYEIFENHSLKELMEKALSTLNEKEEEILKLRFGLMDGQEYTLEDIGLKYNVTRERIRQIEFKALRKMKHSSRSKLFIDYY